jgi:cystathionine gamma-synthase
MMTLWNAANGPSIHAELVGREWVRMGHRLTVFSAIRHPDAKPTGQADEDYVIRHFIVDEVIPVTRAVYFDPKPLLESDYEIFVAQNVERLPTRELYSICREAGCRVIVDNTFASPAAYRPLPDGADIVVESATKYIAGHNDVVAGLVAGLREEDLMGLWDLRRLLGTQMQPFEAYLTWRGLKTLHVRFEAMSKTALRVASWLEDHRCVERVYYPGLPSHPDHAEARRLMPHGLYGGVVSFEIKGGQEAALRFLENLKVVAPSPSFGGTESVVAYPEWSSHRNLPPEEKKALGITPGLLRLSVGMEDPDDIIEDLDQALRRATTC